MAPSVEGIAYFAFGHPEDQWSACQLLKREPGGALLLRRGSKEHAVPAEKAHLLRPRPGCEVLPRNLAELKGEALDAAAVEEALRSHVCGGLVYLAVDEVTVFVNPFRDLQIYDDTWINMYAALDPTLPPHIYSVTAKAYKHLQDKRRDQVLVFLGDSLSGKSRSVRHAMDFLLSTAPGEEDQLDVFLKTMHPLLEPLIGVRSLDCEAAISTRALVSLDVVLDKDGFASHAGVAVELLEVGRLTRSSATTGHTFEALYLALAHPSSSKWVGDRSEFRLLGSACELEEYDLEGEAAARWEDAVQAFGLDMEELVRVLCGIALLGELLVDEPGHAGASEVSLADVAQALGVEPAAALVEALRGGEVAVRATIEGLYRRVVAQVVSAAGSRLRAVGGVAGDARTVAAHSCGRRIRLVEVPSLPGELDRPSAGETLRLQWLAEAVQADLLAAALEQRCGTAGVEDLSERGQIAQGALGAIAGASGLARVLLSMSGNPTEKIREQLSDWASFSEGAAEATAAAAEGPSIATAALAISPLVEHEDARSCTVRGSAGSIEYLLDEHTVRSFVGGDIPLEVLAVISSSSCRLAALLASGAGDFALSVPPAEAAEASISSLRAQMRGEGCQPWVVCCLRPTAACKPGLICKKELLSQIQRYRLADIASCVRGAPIGKGFGKVWSFAAFIRAFSPPGSAPPVPPDDVASAQVACRALIKRVGGEREGFVGLESVYGTERLSVQLEDRLAQLVALQNALQGELEEEKDQETDAVAYQDASLVQHGSMSAIEFCDLRQHQEVTDGDDASIAEHMPSPLLSPMDESASTRTCETTALSSTEFCEQLWQQQEEPELETRDASSGGVDVLREQMREVATSLQAAPAVAEQTAQLSSSLVALKEQLRRLQGSSDDAVSSAAGRTLVLGRTPMGSAQLPVPASAEFPPGVERELRDLREQLRRQQDEHAKQTVVLQAQHRQEVDRVLQQLQVAKESAKQEHRISDISTAASSSALPVGTPVALRPASPSHIGRDSGKTTHSKLHGALSQMAVVLRVSREQEEVYKDEVAILRQECESWRLEADRLWGQVQDLQRQLNEPRHDSRRPFASLPSHAGQSWR